MSSIKALWCLLILCPWQSSMVNVKQPSQAFHQVLRALIIALWSAILPSTEIFSQDPRKKEISLVMWNKYPSFCLVLSAFLTRKACRLKNYWEPFNQNWWRGPGNCPGPLPETQREDCQPPIILVSFPPLFWGGGLYPTNFNFYTWVGVQKISARVGSMTPTTSDPAWRLPTSGTGATQIIPSLNGPFGILS